MAGFTPIDHKEKTADDRAAVLAWVRDQLGWDGAPPTGPDALTGAWHMRFWRADQPDAPWFATRIFHADGQASITAADNSFSNDKDRWQLHEGGVLAEWTYSDPMPEYGLTEPTYTETRFHIRFRDADTFVLINGDGSLILYHERVST